MSQYRRVIVDDSSSDGDDDGGIGDDDGGIGDEVGDDDIGENDGSSDSNIRTTKIYQFLSFEKNVSLLLETLSFTKRNTYGHRVDRTDDEVTSIDEDTYLEDSFLVKDYTSSGDPSNSSNDEQSFKTKRNTCNRQHQEIVQKEADKSVAEISSFFRNDLSDANIDNKNVSMLLELYPELKENVGLKRNSLSNDSIEIRSESTQYDEDSDEKFEKYVERVKIQAAVTKAYGSHDLDGFIMSDSESTGECSSDCESNSSDRSGSVQLIGEIIRNNGDEKIDRHSTPKNISSDLTVYWHHPTAESGISGSYIHKCLGFQKFSPQDDDEIFLLALSPNGPIHHDALKYTTNKFSRIREELAAKLFDLFGRRCFENKLDPNTVLQWNARLRLTAGRCRCKPNGTVDIELSNKVCDTPERLRDTLLHEMCHAAVWVIDNLRKGGHGPAWKYWVYQCQKVFPSLPLIERCHNYTIDAKYLYICDRCGQTIKRHSKSLDTDRKVCGICQGRFILRSRDGKEFSTRPANIFAQFVKENYEKERKPGMKPAEEKGMASETEIITVE
uniref:SprT-like domain-containing protein n=1 Tax=Elaeophora elaphi TaxID=1147741 RepID=A0A0R3RZS9_9BILA